MRHTPCGCRSAHLVEVRSNSRLPPVSTMRRAKQCRYFARSLPPSKRHSRLTIVRCGCNRERLAEDSWRSHVHRTYIAQRVQLFKLQTRNVGGRGGLPSPFSWGSKGDILFGKRISPLTAHSHANGRHPPPRGGGNRRGPRLRVDQDVISSLCRGAKRLETVCDRQIFCIAPSGPHRCPTQASV